MQDERSWLLSAIDRLTEKQAWLEEELTRPQWTVLVVLLVFFFLWTLCFSNTNSQQRPSASRNPN